MSIKDLRIILVRHCQSYGNVSLADSPEFHPDDPPLTPEGERQAIALAKRFNTGDIDRIYSSTLIRTVQTVYPLAQKLNKPIIMVPQLMEMNTSIAGTDVGFIKSNYPLAVPDESGWLMGKETDEITAARADYCIRKILAECNDSQTALIASHGSFFGFLLRRCLDISLPESFCWQVDNCSVTEILLRKDKIPKLVRANDTEHSGGN